MALLFDLDRDFRRLHRNVNNLFRDFEMEWDAPTCNAPRLAAASAESKDHKDNKQLQQSRSSMWTLIPAIDVREDDKHYTIGIELPGVDKQDIKLSVEKNTLTISGEKKQEFKEQKEEKEQGNVQVLRYERQYGCFQRSLMLPENVDPNAIAASHLNGVLTITLPKVEKKEPVAKQIAIQ